MVDSAGEEENVEHNDDEAPNEVAEDVGATVLLIVIIWIVTGTDLDSLLLVLVVVQDEENIPENEGNN